MDGFCRCCQAGLDGRNEAADFGLVGVGNAPRPQHGLRDLPGGHRFLGRLQCLQNRLEHVSLLEPRFWLAAADGYRADM